MLGIIIGRDPSAKQCCNFMPSKLDISAIYKILNLVNGKFYIGSAVNVRIRWNHHLLQLRRGDHHSRHLQKAFYKYGESNFVLQIIECIPLRADLIPREQFWLDILKVYDAEVGYNIHSNARSAFGVKRSVETRGKIRQAKLGKPSWNKGKRRPPFSEEWKRNMSKAQ